MYNRPLAYFITFTTYGTWLHGDERGSVLIEQSQAKQISPTDCFCNHQKRQMKYPAVVLDSDQREIVLQTIIAHCTLQNWRLYAVHVRSNHVHLLVFCTEKPDKVMGELKAWATRKLRQAHCTLPKVWTQHGSTQLVFIQAKLKEKIRYIILEQGDPMAYYYNELFQDTLDSSGKRKRANL